jgi:hypothetical protein
MDTITSLVNVDISGTIIIVCTILIGSKAVVSLIAWWTDKLGIETKWTRSRKEEHELLQKTSQNLTELQERHASDKNQLLEAQKEMSKSINDMAEKVNTLMEFNQKYELADMRETLLSAYRYYANVRVNPRLEWTEMEAHAYKEQLASYEQLGGNDFIHTDVEPDMEKLIVIPMKDTASISRLMESRHI